MENIIGEEVNHNFLYVGSDPSRHQNTMDSYDIIACKSNIQKNVIIGEDQDINGGDYHFFSFVKVIYHYIELIWIILVTPRFCITYMITKTYHASEPVKKYIQSLINIIQGNNCVII